MKQCLAEIAETWKSLPIPAIQVLEALYECGTQTSQHRDGYLNLSTVHGGKGREFKHVLILDGGDWRNGQQEDERRLYYVGMTRAMETLTLCEARQRPNAFTLELEASEYLLRAAPAEIPIPLPQLDKRYKMLGLADVDLGFAGRKGPNDPVHRAIARLRVGGALQFKEGAGLRELRDSHGTVVGRLSKNCELPPGRVLEMTVSAIVTRTERQQATGYKKHCLVEEWEVVLANVVATP